MVKPVVFIRQDERRPAVRIEAVRLVPAIPVRIAPWSRGVRVVKRDESDGGDHASAAESDSWDEPAASSAPQLPPVPAPDATPEDGEKRARGRPGRRMKEATYHDPRAFLEKQFELKMSNYAAVDPARKLYGLIDRGLSDAKTRALILHVRSKQDPGPVIDGIKPGTFLPATSKSKRGGTTQLRVRYTTPNTYYSPGRKITSIAVGVDEADWQSLVAKAHRI